MIIFLNIFSPFANSSEEFFRIPAYNIPGSSFYAAPEETMTRTKYLKRWKESPLGRYMTEPIRRRPFIHQYDRKRLKHSIQSGRRYRSI